MIVLLSAFVGLYALSRWASSQTEASTEEMPEAPLEPYPAPLVESPQSWPKVVPIDSRPQFERTEVVDEESLRPVHILNMNFKTFDLVPGPPDPSSFANELIVELYDENSGHNWTQTYFVTTPRGLDEMLEREQWQYAFSDQTFFVRRYDAKVIRQMTVEQFTSTQEKPSPPKDAEDSYV
jgi:hypothetical protein